MSDEQLISALTQILDGDVSVVLFRLALLGILLRTAVPFIMWVKGKTNGGTMPDKVMGRLDELVLYQKRQARMTRSLRDEMRAAYKEQARATEALSKAADRNNDIAERLLEIVKAMGARHE